MAIDYVMPKLAMAMSEGTVNEWLVADGQYVEKGAPIATIETEKVAYDIESPESGFFHIVLPSGETVDCGEIIGQFAASEDELAELQQRADNSAASADAKLTAETTAETVVMAPAQGAERHVSGRIIASPLARKMAKDRGLELSSITGTGPKGRIVKRDIIAIATRQPAQGALTALAGSAEKARIPLQGMRRTISERMMQSLSSTAQLSAAWESDITDLLKARSTLVTREEQLGTRVSVNAFIIKAMVYAARQVPLANACQEGDDIVIYDSVNMGIAVSLPGQSEYDSGLMVAVLRGVDRMGLTDIDKGMKALIERVRNGSASADDLSGSTITLSSTAGIAPPGMQSTPVLNLPNVALVGPSTPIEKPVVHDGQIVVRTMLPVSFTFDHRILDGDPAARFMHALHEALENPELLLA